MMHDVAVAVTILCQQYEQWTPPPVTVAEDTAATLVTPAAGIPESTGAGDVVCFLGNPPNGSLAVELSGSAKIALDAGATVIVALQTLERGGHVLLMGIADPEIPLVTPGGLMQTDSASPMFDEFITRYGSATTAFEPLLEGAESLARAEEGSVAFTLDVGLGHLYVLPYFVHQLSASHDLLIRSLLHAVTSHLHHRLLEPSKHLDVLRLPGESSVLKRISDLGAQVADAEREAEVLARYRHLAGRATGDAFERLVIDSLNFVLDRTPFAAEDRPDVGTEDFVIVGPDGDYALAEAKGIRSHVRRLHVSQVEANRAVVDDADDGP